MARTVERLPWKSLQAICEVLYNGNPFMTPYQSYQFLSTTGLGFQLKKPFAAMGYKEVNFVLYRDKEPIAVAPLYVRKYREVYKLLFRGELTTIGHLDFIYDVSFCYDDFVFLMDSIKRHFGKYYIKFDRISDKSLTFAYCQRYFHKEMNKSICVSIPVFQTYNDWYSSLSKNVRQNIRTSYNRMNTDNKEYRFELFVDKLVPKKIRNKMINLFSRRIFEHSNIKKSFLLNILEAFKRYEKMTKALYKHPRSISACVYIDSSMAAFCTGVIGNDGRAIMARVSMNSDFRRYSPGGILINEIMKKIAEDENCFGINEIDLSRGEEKYKYDYGGIEHYNYEWEITS